MFKAMHMDDRNFEGDELAGYFESEEALIESLKKFTENNRNCIYAGTEMYGGKQCYVVASKESSRHPFKSRYYLVKIENGWI